MLLVADASPLISLLVINRLDVPAFQVCQQTPGSCGGIEG